MTEVDLGVIGLAVMGQNLVLNMADHELRVAVYNRTEATTRAFASGSAAARVAEGAIVPTFELPALIATLSRPRKVLLMVKAGAVVDAVIDQISPLLEPGDIIVDGGNSNYADTDRRVTVLAEKGLLFVGSGVSGGEEGARNGPSIMPGGAAGARDHVMPIMEAIAARASDGAPTTAWLGPGGSGHFVKMVHNGIEYGDMQVLAEAYALLGAMGYGNAAMADIFKGWGEGVLDSYLVDITADILATVDEGGTAVIDQILDAAGQKGSGRWTVTTALEIGQPLSLIAEAVMARQISAAVDLRAEGAGVLSGPTASIGADQLTPQELEQAIYGSKIISYAQGFALLDAASKDFDWGLDQGTVAAIWRAGSIVRARFLEDITSAYRDGPAPSNLLFAPFFAAAMTEANQAMRKVVAAGTSAGVALPAHSSALAYYDAIRSRRLPANLIQAQRDYFGAHTYERVDKPRGEHFHTNWTGTGGTTTSTSYNA